jgi:hypothetical protein
MVGGVVTRVETFSGEVGDLEGVPCGSDAGSSLFGEAVGEGLWVVMGNNDQRMHGNDSFGGWR